MVRHALRTCRVCGLEALTEENLEGFVISPRGLHGRARLCKSCQSETARNNPNRFIHRARSHVKDNYGITVEVYKERMATSDNCGICGDGDNLCYDHDHSTMLFRGVLCGKCNRGLGLFGDNIEGLMKAIEYLVRGN